MKMTSVQLNPGTRIPLPDGTYSEYGAVVTVDEDTARTLTTGPNPSGTELVNPIASSKRPRREQEA